MTMRKPPDDAIVLGNKYFTGKPCARGHISARLVSCGNCVKCAREDSKKYGPLYYEKNKEEIVKNIKKKNDDSKLRAKNKYEPWGGNEINSVLMRNKDGGYALSEEKLSELLGRTIVAIKRARHRFKK